MQARILDRGCSHGGECEDRFLVGIVEFAVRFLGQVQVAPRLAANQQRDSQEAAHRGMSNWEAVRLRMASDVGEPQWLRIVDQHSKDAASAGEIPDLRLSLGIDAVRYEAFQ